MTKQRTSPLAVMIATALLVVVWLFPLSVAGMHHHADAPMEKCPLMLDSGLCSMSPLEHVGFWQLQLAGVIPEPTQWLWMMFVVTLILLCSSTGKLLLNIGLRRLPDADTARDQSRRELVSSIVPRAP